MGVTVMVGEDSAARIVELPNPRAAAKLRLGSEEWVPAAPPGEKGGVDSAFDATGAIQLEGEVAGGRRRTAERGS